MTGHLQPATLQKIVSGKKISNEFFFYNLLTSQSESILNTSFKTKIFFTEKFQTAGFNVKWIETNNVYMSVKIESFWCNKNYKKHITKFV